MKMPLITVAICTFNRAAVLRRTLEHMRAMEVPSPFEWELLVVDNKSTDNTPQVLNEMAGRLPVRMLRELKTGQSYARNLILREARGQWIVWTDDDALVDARWLATIMATFQTTGEI